MSFYEFKCFHSKTSGPNGETHKACIDIDRVCHFFPHNGGSATTICCEGITIYIVYPYVDFKELMAVKLPK